MHIVIVIKELLWSERVWRMAPHEILSLVNLMSTLFGPDFQLSVLVVIFLLYEVIFNLDIVIRILKS